jgi:hypothetical protein
VRPKPRTRAAYERLTRGVAAHQGSEGGWDGQLPASSGQRSAAGRRCSTEHVSVTARGSCWRSASARRRRTEGQWRAGTALQQGLLSRSVQPRIWCMRHAPVCMVVMMYACPRATVCWGDVQAELGTKPTSSHRPLATRGFVVAQLAQSPR